LNNGVEYPVEASNRDRPADGGSRE